MKNVVFALLISLAACGGKSGSSTTPSNAGGNTATQPKKDGAGSMGGATYGNAGTSQTDPNAPPADPCAAPPQ
jgi:hypothetical protein